MTLLKSTLFSSVCAMSLATAALGEDFNIPAGSLNAALNAYSKQAGVPLIVSADMVRGATTKGVAGNLQPEEALSRILSGTGFTVYHDPAGALGIARGKQSAADMTGGLSLQLAQAAPPPRGAVETVTVTSSKLGGADVQSIPIAITALSQEQLTSTQTAGGPDLIKQVPNLTFSKTNFTGYNIQIRGIGTQAVSVTTDPAVAVAFNDTPFIRNHFFEQEFFDVAQVEVLRGPQGTLFGRNATAGVVNVISAKPTDHYEANASLDVGNYNNRRLEGMVNIPVWSDKVDLRVAGEWTKRDGYEYNDVTDRQIDGRDLFTTRVSLLVHPIEKLTATAIWEHFQEDDDRARSTKQLCERSYAPAVVDGPAGPQVPTYGATGFSSANNEGAAWLSQGCSPASLYSPQSFETPNAAAIPFVAAFNYLDTAYLGSPTTSSNPNYLDPYASLTQPRNLRTISSQIDPVYRAKNDTFEFNADYNLTPELTLTSETGYNTDFLYSTEDFNRFTTAPDFLNDQANNPYLAVQGTFVGQDNEYCDPQLGCSSRFVAEDRSSETARQFYQELRLSSDFKGPLNFVFGSNYMHYATSEDYYGFSNLLTLLQESINSGYFGGGVPGIDARHIPFDGSIANECNPQPATPALLSNSFFGLGCAYIDPNPINQVNGQGHNYFLSHNPYQLQSWATFGEVYYQITPDVKLTGGLRYTDDKKTFEEYPSWALFVGQGIPRECALPIPECQGGVVAQQWKEWTGRAVVNWTPKLDFTDQTLVYGSYAHGYKGGGANPPGVTPLFDFGYYLGSASNLTHPLTFKPEFNDAFELGTKNTLADGAVTLNADVFYYKYSNYQISQIVDRTAVNFNFNATVRGAELESSWEPVPGLKFGFTGGYENATFDKNQYSIDLMDRTAGHPGWLVVKPFIAETSNCILPTATVNEVMARAGATFQLDSACQYAYSLGLDPATQSSYVAYPDPVNLPGYAGFDPTTAPNNGEGFTKNIGGNQLPNAPHFTTSLSADYTRPVSEEWAATLHGDFYWQAGSYWRIFNDSDYDKLRGYTNLNFTLIFTNQDGWQTMAYVKNALDTTAITGAFLNSDDTALTTNVFTTDPRLFGIRIIKNW